MTSHLPQRGVLTPNRGYATDGVHMLSHVFLFFIQYIWNDKSHLDIATPPRHLLDAVLSNYS